MNPARQPIELEWFRGFVAELEARGVAPDVASSEARTAIQTFYLRTRRGPNVADWQDPERAKGYFDTLAASIIGECAA